MTTKIANLNKCVIDCEQKISRIEWASKKFIGYACEDGCCLRFMCSSSDATRRIAELTARIQKYKAKIAHLEHQITQNGACQTVE